MTRIVAYPPHTGASLVPPSPLIPSHFLGLLPHPGNRAPPSPVRPPLRPLPRGWTRSFHAAPAAYPRQFREAHGTLRRESHPYRSREPSAGETKDERRARLQGETADCVRRRYDAYEWSLEEAAAAAPPGLFLGVERWRRDTPRGGATVVCTHANGTQREHWHPVLRALIEDDSGPGVAFGTGQPLSGGKADIVIDDVWFIDDVTHNTSMDLNAGLIGPCELWDDTGRDVLNFVLHVLPLASAGEVGWQLPWGAEGAAAPVKVIGLGASFGGAAQAQAATARPDAFQGIFTVDPMLAPRVNPRTDPIDMAPFFRAVAALKRRDTWSSRSAARDALLQSEFFQRWDSEIFELTISHGLVPVDAADPDGPVTLGTPTWAETSVFVEPFSAARGWDMLPRLAVPTAFLMAGNPERTLGPAVTREMVWRPQRPRNERLDDADHLILQEQPGETTLAVRRFLHTLLSGQWGTKEEIREEYSRAGNGGEDEARAKL